MELNKKHLEQWLEESKGGFEVNRTFIDFYSLYQSLKVFLLPKHQETTHGAIIDDIRTKAKEMTSNFDKLVEQGAEPDELKKCLFENEKILWLNDHGPDHINTVIKRASQLVDCSINLSPREVYCLLCAIQLHDLGNFYGRIGHEQRILEIVGEASDKIGSDHVEKKHIVQIAQVHGGKVANTNDKDTISTLKIVAPVRDEPIRLRLIAAILRFADELADERSRASINLLNEGKIPKSSEIYHAYSACISSVLVDHPKNTVELHFDIPKRYLKRKFGKDDKETFLIDEIHLRAIKMHRERKYCSRFWKSHIDLENILVIINFYDDNLQGEVHPEITFTVKESGYPENNKNIFQICPNLTLGDGTQLNGEYFQQKLFNDET